MFKEESSFLETLERSEKDINPHRKYLEKEAHVSWKEDIQNKLLRRLDQKILQNYSENPQSGNQLKT